MAKKPTDKRKNPEFMFVFESRVGVSRASDDVNSKQNRDYLSNRSFADGEAETLKKFLISKLEKFGL